MEIFIALAVIVIILLGALVMTLARLAAAAALISSGVARIGAEVTETTAAIRAHLEGDSGISQSALLEQVEKLETAGAALTEAANSLDSLQTELNAGPSDALDENGQSTSADVNPAVTGDEDGDNDAPDVDPAVTGDAGGAPASGSEGSDFGNQNGIGSEFEQGSGGGDIDLNSQSDTPADANGGKPANEPDSSVSDASDDDQTGNS